MGAVGRADGGVVGDGVVVRTVLPEGPVVFAWTFTTQSVVAELEALRACLYGFGALAPLGAEFPPVIAEVFDVDIPSSGPGFEELSRLAAETRT